MPAANGLRHRDPDNRLGHFLLGPAVLILALSPVFAQPSGSGNLEHLRQLRDEGAWQEILDATCSETRADSEQAFLRGLALAHLGQFEAAEVELKQAAEEAGDTAADILVELAGVQFKLKKMGEASKNLHRAIRLGEADPYVFDFLASLYYLDGNLEAAVKYWNRIGKPNVQELKLEPDGILDPVLLDRAVAVSPASRLALDSLRLTDLRLEMLDIFARRRYDLAARADGDFDLTVQTAEKADIRAGSTLRSALAAARELPFRTLNADVVNINRSAVNWTSAFRWKFGNHLFDTRFSAPFRRNPNLRYQAGITVRDEQWDISSWGDANGLTGLKSTQADVGISAIGGDRWIWSTGVSVSHRDLSTRFLQGASPDSVWASGFAVSSKWGSRYDLLRLPERRIKLSGEAHGELGRFFNPHGGLFTVGQLAVNGVWEAQKEDRTLITARAAAGRSAGSIPFDRLFRLGMDRDSDLLLRGHRGTSNSLKGSSPMGAGYLLNNFDVQKRLYHNGFLSFSSGPFLDSGRVYEPRSAVAHRWMWDTGLEGRLRLLGFLELAVSYGIDTRSGTHLVFWRVTSR